MIIPRIAVSNGYTASLKTESNSQGLITSAEVTVSSDLTGLDHQIGIDINKPFEQQINRGLSLIEPIDKQLHKIINGGGECDSRKESAPPR